MSEQDKNNQAQTGELVDPQMNPAVENATSGPVALADDIKSKLSPEQLQQAGEMAKQIDVTKQNSLITYGTQQQQALSTFSDQVLGKVRNKDIGEIGDSLRKLVSSLSDADPEKLVGQNASVFAKLFSRVKSSIFEMTAKYQEVSVQIDRSSKQLETQEQKLLTDNDTMDQMYEQNMQFYQQLNVLIAGANLKQTEIKNEIAELQAGPNDQMVAQKISDLNAVEDRLEKRMMDLMLTREITVQQAPQIRLIQNSNSVLAEKIQSSITTAIPLWKNQVALALALLNQKDALAAQNAVADTTNELLKKNSEMLKQSTLDIAKASQRGVVDVDTLKETQDNLISTVTEAIQIQQEGAQKRKTAEVELQNMEQSMQEKITAVNGSLTDNEDRHAN